MKKELDLASLNRYVKPQEPKFEKAMKNASSKYDKIKEAIKVLLENYEKDRHDFNIRTSQKVSKVFIQNNLDNIKSILTDDTTIEDFVAALDITVGSLTFTTQTDREYIKNYILANIKKILKDEEEETENKPAYISVETLEETKEKIKDSVISMNSALITPKINALNNSIKVNSAIIASTISSISKLNLKLHGTTLKLRLMKLKNSVIGTASKVIGATKNFFKKGWNSVVTAFKWVGKAIVASLVAIGKGLSKLLGGIFKFVGKIFTGVIVGVLSLVTGVFGLLFKGLMVIVGGIFFIFKMAIKAVTLALGIIGGIVFWAVKGVFKTVSWIVGGVKDLLEAHKSLVKKAIKGIFATLGVFFLTPKGAYFLGLIARFTWKYIILPIAGGFSAAYDLIIKTKDDLVKWISEGFGVAKPDEKSQEEEKKTIIGRITTAITGTEWFQAIDTHLGEVLTTAEHIVDEISNSIGSAIAFAKEIPGMLVGRATTFISAGAGFWIGKIIGTYLGGPGLGMILCPVGALIGGAIGYLFETRKQEKFEKVRNLSTELEEIGVQKNIMLTSSKRVPSERSVKRKTTASILTRNMTAGAKQDKTKTKELPIDYEKVNKLFKNIEEAKQQSLLGQTREVGDYFESYKSNVETPMSIQGTTLSIPDFSITDSRKKLEEKLKTQLSAARTGKDFNLKKEIDTLFASAKDTLVTRFSSNKFIKDRLSTYNWSLDINQFKTPEEASGALLDQIYSLYGLSAYLMLAQTLVTGYLTQNEILDYSFDESDPFVSIKWLLMFAKNNEVLNSVTLDDFHSFYSSLEKEDKYNPDHPSVTAIFSEPSQTKRAMQINNFINQILQGYMSAQEVFDALNALLPTKSFDFITKSTKLLDFETGWLQQITNIFNDFFKEAGITDNDMKAAIIGQVFAKCLDRAKLNFASAFSGSSNRLFSDILTAFSSQNILTELSKLTSSIDMFRQTQMNIEEWDNAFSTGQLEKFRNTSVENLESAFETVLANILSDKEVNKEETKKFQQILSMFKKEDVEKIIAKLKQKFNKSDGLDKEAEQNLFVVVQQYNDSPEGQESKDSNNNELQEYE